MAHPGTFRSMRAGAAANVVDALRTIGDRELINPTGRRIIADTCGGS